MEGPLGRGDFFHFEIMDLDFLPKPALAAELGRKFQKLENLSQICLETLESTERLGNRAERGRDQNDVALWRAQQ